MMEPTRFVGRNGLLTENTLDSGLNLFEGGN